MHNKEQFGLPLKHSGICTQYTVHGAKWVDHAIGLFYPTNSWDTWRMSLAKWPVDEDSRLDTFHASHIVVQC